MRVPKQGEAIKCLPSKRLLTLAGAPSWPQWPCQAGLPWLPITSRSAPGRVLDPWITWLGGPCSSPSAQLLRCAAPVRGHWLSAPPGDANSWPGDGQRQWLAARGESGLRPLPAVRPSPWAHFLPLPCPTYLCRHRSRTAAVHNMACAVLQVISAACRRMPQRPRCTQFGSLAVRFPQQSCIPWKRASHGSRMRTREVNACVLCCLRAQGRLCCCIC